MSEQLQQTSALDEETARAEVYGLLARLYYSVPDAELLSKLRVAVTEAPAAGPATTDPLATAEATPGATAAPGTPAAGAPVELPEAITGQPADQQTCSVGFFG